MRSKLFIECFKCLIVWLASYLKFMINLEIFNCISSCFVQDTIYITDELVLEAHPEPERPYILLRREGEAGEVRVYLHEVRYLADALCSMAAEVTGVVMRGNG